MLALTIDTSTPAITATVERVGPGLVVDTLASRVSVDGRRNAEILAPAIQACLGEVGCGPAELAAVVVGLGPGPFTGLRVGLMTADALADALVIPTYGVCSLDAIAAGCGSVAGRPLLVATDARRREVYWALYDHDGVRVIGPEVNRPADVAAILGALPAHERPAVAIGEGAHRYTDVLGVPAVADATPVPTLIALAVDRVATKAPGERLTPLYLRRPDAVELAARKQALP